MARSDKDSRSGLPLWAWPCNRFARDERGNLTVFAFTLFMLMVMVGGLAVDLMRYESTRTALQNTLDRATLASASLSQRLDAEDLVIDYFDKAGLASYLRSVNVDEGLNYRTVEADARAATNPYFLHLLGIRDMDAPGHSMAEQRMTNVEITMVLDVSGSMNDNNRLNNLKTAAKEFVDTVLSGDNEDKISIGIVPFNGQVDLGETLRERYNATKVHGVDDMNCVDLPASAYAQTGIPTTLGLPMTTVTDTYSTTNKTDSYVSRTDSNYAVNVNTNRWCPDVNSANTIMLPSQSISALQTKIQGLYGIGATSINAGMKWGMAMVDPGTRPVFDYFVTKSKIAKVFEGRPYEYTDPETMKIIVLMTDGSHFAEDRLNDDYKAGISPIYKSPIDGNYSIRFTSGRPGVSGSREYWVPHRSEWRSKPWTNTSDTGASSLAPILWQQVWSEVRLQWVVWQLYARALGTNNSQRSKQYDAWIAEFRQQTGINTMDDQLQAMCAMAKSNGVTVYGISFEAPTAGQTEIAACATSSAHYFKAAGLQIRTAFRAIASNISQLRLTQ